MEKNITHVNYRYKLGVNSCQVKVTLCNSTKRKALMLKTFEY